MVGSDVEKPLFHRRLVDRADVPVLGGSLMAGDGVARPDLSHHRQTVAIELARQIGTESSPCVAAIGALEQIVRAEVDRVVIVWRDQHRRAPVPAIWPGAELGKRLDGFLLPGSDI